MLERTVKPARRGEGLDLETLVDFDALRPEPAQPSSFPLGLRWPSHDPETTPPLFSEPS